MYINFWYPVCLSDEINEGPKKATILGLEFVAFRDHKGNAHCLSNVCVHRGGSLAHGICHDDGTIACPYHGWRFDGSGKCQKIPSLGPGSKVPKRAKVDSYPVQEKYGIVFAFLGDQPEKERPMLYEIQHQRFLDSLKQIVGGQIIQKSLMLNTIMSDQLKMG